MNADAQGPGGIQVPNDNRGVIVLAVVSSLTPLAGLVVALRFYSRRYFDNYIGLDDWAVLTALVFFVALGITVCLEVQVGLGQRTGYLSDAQIQEFAKRFYFSVVLYYCGLGSIKVALLLQYRRIFRSKFRRAIDAALIVIGSWSLGLVLVSIFTCYPIQGYWDKNIHAKCIPSFQWYIHSAGNILSDIVILTLPIPTLWNMRVSLAKRLVCVIIFSLGFFNCAISVIRIMYLPIVNANPDITYDSLDATAWTIAEVCLAIICACLPTLRPLYVPAARERLAMRMRSCCGRERKGSQNRGPLSGLQTSEGVSPAHKATSLSCDKNDDAENHGPALHVRPVKFDTTFEKVRGYHPQNQSPCAQHGYELMESPVHDRLARSRTRSPVGMPFQPPERRRPSVQSILDEIVVTQPPSAIIHEALGSNFPVRVTTRDAQPPRPSTLRRYCSADTAVAEVRSAARPRMRRMGSSDSARSVYSDYALRRGHDSPWRPYDTHPGS